MGEAPRWRGYRRADGQVGVRNHVVILPVDDLSNRTAEAVAQGVPGTVAIAHPYGRLQYGEDLELFFRTLIGTGQNPNVAAVVVVAIEPNWARHVADGIAASQKPVEAFAIERHGDLRTTEMASRTAARLLADASEAEREDISAKDLVFSTKCGESDTTSGLASNPTVGRVIERIVDLGGTAMFGETSELTGGEHIVAERMATPALKERFLAVHKAYLEAIEHSGADLLGSQPTQGNIAGGLSTIEEKALGNIEKIGRSTVHGVLAPAERPQGPGLHFMDTSSAGAEAVTLWAAAGAAIHLFTTGQGNIVGHPILPVVKISANPRTVSEMAEHIDVDVSGLLRGELSLDEAADAVWSMASRVSRGRLTAAEVLGHREFAPTRLFPSA
jgi:(2R)-sulfolactate sulfo-lyase subunit beta